MAASVPHRVIAEALKCTRQHVTKLVKQGMDTSSLEAACAWYRANVSSRYRHRSHQRDYISQRLVAQSDGIKRFRTWEACEAPTADDFADELAPDEPITNEEEAFILRAAMHDIRQRVWHQPQRIVELVEQRLSPSQAAMVREACEVVRDKFFEVYSWPQGQVPFEHWPQGKVIEYRNAADEPTRKVMRVV
jgi:hypothetical protein